MCPTRILDFIPRPYGSWGLWIAYVQHKQSLTIVICSALISAESRQRRSRSPTSMTIGQTGYPGRPIGPPSREQNKTSGSLKNRPPEYLSLPPEWRLSDTGNPHIRNIVQPGWRAFDCGWGNANLISIPPSSPIIPSSDGLWVGAGDAK